MMTLSQLEKTGFAYSHPANQLKEAIARQSTRLFAEGDAARDAIATPEALRERQEAVRRFLIDAFGGLPPSDTPLNPRVTGSLRREGYTMEKVIFESRPRHYVTTNLYLPDDRAEKTPAVLFLCGHSANGKAADRYQSVCQMLARAGLIVLAMDPVGQGERWSYYDAATGKLRVRAATGDHDYAGTPCRLVGDTIARYFLHDAMRALDYLATRPEVDASRLGVTGNSGGGTQTCMLMATDPRIQAAAPGTFVMNRESYFHTGQAQDAEQIWPGFTAAGFDHEDLLLAMAPKSLAVLAVQSDFFPIEGTRRSVERVRRFWEMHDCPARLELCEDASTHGYTTPLARHAARFFAQHLLGRTIDTSTWEGSPLPEAEIACTTSGQVSGDFADAEFVFHANVARVAEAATERHALPPEERKARAIGWLREQVFGPREVQTPSGPISPRLILSDEVCEAFDVDTAFWYPQPYVANLGHLFRLPGQERRGVTIALWEDGSRRIRDHYEWLTAEAAQGRAVLVLNLSAMGPLEPVAENLYGFYGLLFKLDDELRWNGDSLAALRTWEVTRAIDALERLPGQWSDLDLSDLRLYGCGPEGVYARLAAAVDPRVKSHTWENPFTWTSIATSRYYNTHNIKPRLLPGALRYFDLDEIA